MTTSIAGRIEARDALPVTGRERASSPQQDGGASLATLDSFLRLRFDADDGAAPILDAARTRALQASRAAGGDDAADRLAASVYAGSALLGLTVEGLLREADARGAAACLAVSSLDGTSDSVLLELFLRAISDPLIADLPPLFAVETQLRLLVTFGAATEVSLWLRPRPGRIQCAVQLGEEEPSRRARAAAKLALANGPLGSLARRSQVQAIPLLRWGRTDAALVARVPPGARAAAQTYLRETATALTPLLERAALLERSADREQMLTSGTERRLTRLGFDLHDGPIQDVIALAGDVRELRDEIYPFIAETHRDNAERRLDSVVERLSELDAELRELAHSLESRSAVSRPVEEVLHREVDAFTSRTGIRARLRIEGTCSSLTTSQRIALFRAVQEALSNAREHSGATSVEIRLRARRAWTELKIWDNGRGFRVEHGLASAAKRGRLGIVGISERVRMLGGTFEIESAPGGPTRLSISLPRWEPLDPAAGS